MSDANTAKVHVTACQCGIPARLSRPRAADAQDGGRVCVGALILSTGAAFEAVAKATTVGPCRGSRRRTRMHALSGVDDGISSTSALSAAVSSRRGLASLPGSARSLVGEPSLRTGVCVIKVPPRPKVKPVENF